MTTVELYKSNCRYRNCVNRRAAASVKVRGKILLSTMVVKHAILAVVFTIALPSGWCCFVPQIGWRYRPQSCCNVCCANKSARTKSSSIPPDSPCDACPCKQRVIASEPKTEPLDSETTAFLNAAQKGAGCRSLFAAQSKPSLGRVALTANQRCALNCVWRC